MVEVVAGVILTIAGPMRLSRHARATGARRVSLAAGFMIDLIASLASSFELGLAAI